MSEVTSDPPPQQPSPEETFQQFTPSAHQTARMSSIGGLSGAPQGVPLGGAPGGPGGPFEGAEGFADEKNILGGPPTTTNNTLGTREYMEKEIVPSLLPALAAVCEERPPAPVEYLAHYLLEKSFQKKH